MTWPLRAFALLAVSVLVLASCSSASSESVFELRPGDCFDDVIEDDKYVEESGSLPMVDCDEPHDNEAFAAFDVEGNGYPGLDALDDEAIARCVPLFEGYVGSSYEDTTRLEIMWLAPTSESWDDGDREIVCVLYDSEIKKMTGSMSKSGA